MEDDSNRPEVLKEVLENISPSVLREYVDKIVAVVHGEEQAEATGVIYTVDPVSLTFILIDISLCRDNKPKITVVPGHSVKSVRVIGQCDAGQKKILSDIFNDFTNSTDGAAGVDVTKRKAELLEWFQKNRFPASLGEENPEIICIADALIIEPPYRPENCLSKNEIILNKIQNLIKSMPLSE